MRSHSPWVRHAMKINRDLPVSPAAPGIAREALDGWLTNVVGEDAATSARMAATEIVADAVRHGGLDPTDVIHMSGVATTTSCASASRRRRQPRTFGLVPIGERDPTDGGIDLRIVDVAASSWGVDPGPPGVVWFEVDRRPSQRLGLPAPASRPFAFRDLEEVVVLPVEAIRLGRTGGRDSVC
jgi:hypothetical protein